MILGRIVDSNSLRIYPFSIGIWNFVSTKLKVEDKSISEFDNKLSEIVVGVIAVPDNNGNNNILSFNRRFYSYFH